MAKKNEKKQEQPSYVDELLTDGTTVLTAKSCEELAELVDKIPADCSYGAGAVGRNPETGMFTLRLDSLKD